MHVIYDDITSARIRELLIGHPNLPEEAWAPVRRIRRTTVSPVLQGIALPPGAAWGRLVQYSEALEKEVKTLLSGHSRYYWMHVGRRHLPTKEREDSLETGAFGETILDLAILKFGSSGHTDMVETQDTSGRLATITASLDWNDLLAFNQGHALCLELARVQAKLRSVGKGHSVIVGDDLEFGLLPNAAAEARISSFEHRKREYGDLFGMAGYAAHLEMPGDASLAIWCPVPNWSEKPFTPEWASHYDIRLEPSLSFVPSFVLLPFDYGPIHGMLSSLGDDVKVLLGCPSTHLSCALFGLCTWRHNLAFGDWQEFIQLAQRGYSLSTCVEWLCDRIAETAVLIGPRLGETLDVAEATTAAHGLLKCATYTEGDIRSIDLWEKTPLRMAMSLDGGAVLVDYSKVPHFVYDLVRRLTSRGGSLGNARGRASEKQVIDTIRKELPEAALWRCQSEVRAAGNRRDVDASFVLGEALILVECRSKIVSLGFDKGVPAEMERRRSEVLDEKLRKVDSLAKLLAQNPVGDNYSLPAQVRVVLSLACSPFTEYVDVLNGYYMLTDSIPRVCVPRELVQFARTFSLSQHLGKQHCFEVKGR